MSAAALSLELIDPIATLWLDRPEKQNAMSFSMWAELPAVLARAASSSARVLELRGVGEHFCSGADISSIGAGLAESGSADSYRAINEAADEALATLPLPSLAVIQGNCVGGGCQLAAACDLRIASRSARFGVTPAKLGITYPASALLRLADLIGVGATKRLLFTAELIDAPEALRLGLIDLLVDDDQLEQAASSLSATLASRSLVTQLATKRLLGSLLGPREEADVLTRYWEELARRSGDLSEGLAAFEGRRAPRFGWHPNQEQPTDEESD
jgi:enoyl-CoA hydratase/carnithine racemase